MGFRPILSDSPDNRGSVYIPNVSHLPRVYQTIEFLGGYSPASAYVSPVSNGQWTFTKGYTPLGPKKANKVLAKRAQGSARSTEGRKRCIGCLYRL